MSETGSVGASGALALRAASNKRARSSFHFVVAAAEGGEEQEGAGPHAFAARHGRARAVVTRPVVGLARPQANFAGRAYRRLEAGKRISASVLPRARCGLIPALAQTAPIRPHRCSNTHRMSDDLADALAGNAWRVRYRCARPPRPSRRDALYVLHPRIAPLACIASRLRRHFGATWNRRTTSDAPRPYAARRWPTVNISRPSAAKPGPKLMRRTTTTSRRCGSSSTIAVVRWDIPLGAALDALLADQHRCRSTSPYIRRPATIQRRGPGCE